MEEISDEEDHCTLHKVFYFVDACLVYLDRSIFPLLTSNSSYLENIWSITNINLILEENLFLKWPNENLGKIKLVQI